MIISSPFPTLNDLTWNIKATWERNIHWTEHTALKGKKFLVNQPFYYTVKPQSLFVCLFSIFCIVSSCILVVVCLDLFKSCKWIRNEETSAEYSDQSTYIINGLTLQFPPWKKKSKKSLIPACGCYGAGVMWFSDYEMLWNLLHTWTFLVEIW